MSENDANLVLELQTKLAKLEAEKTAGDSVKQELADALKRAEKAETDRDSYKRAVEEQGSELYERAFDSLTGILTKAGLAEKDWDPILEKADYDSVKVATSLLSLIDFDAPKHAGTESKKTKVGGDSDLPAPEWTKWYNGRKEGGK